MKTLVLFFAIAILSQQSYSQKGILLDSVSIEKSEKQKVMLRCGGSIQYWYSPLYVVDGVPMESGEKGLTDLDPNNIESIQIIKDANSFSCYGTAAQNGVVLITTKNNKNPITKPKKYAFKTYEVCEDNWNTLQDVYNDIQAKVPGVSIASNRSVNSIPRISMRGDDNTIVIVDGIRYDASILNTLNPSDIESVTVAPSVAATNYLRNN